MDLELPIVLYVEVGKRVKNLYNSKFRKMLPVYSILRNSELSYIEILKFVQNLPFCFICSQSYPRNIFQRNFSILCSKCKIKTIDIQILKDLKKGKISISYICKHLQKTIIETETNLTRFLHFNLEMDENQIFYIKSRFSVKHPLRMIGKVIVDSTDSSIIKFYLTQIIYSKSWEWRNSIKFSKCSILQEIMNFKSGYYFLFLFDSIINNNLLIYNNKSVQCLVWIPSYIKDYISIGSYIQIDASFYALHPYVYSIPLLIYNNSSIPLGIVMGPSESEKLYDLIYQCIEKILGRKINNIPILSDEGTAIASFASNRNIDQYLCYRHLIEKIGSRTYIAQIVRRLLFIPTIDKYEIELVQAIAEVNCLIKNNDINYKTAKQFTKIFSLNLDNNNMIQFYSSNHPNGLWNRQLIGISTCSNHIESLHKALNTLTASSKNIYKRTNIVISKLEDMINNFEVNSRRQAVKLLEYMNKKAEEMEIPQYKQCPCNCGWGEVYSNRFGISNFPCVHTIKYCNIEFNNLSLPKSKNQINEIMEIKSIRMDVFRNINNQIQFFTSFKNPRI